MTKIIFILIAFLMVSVTAVMAQSPAPDPDTLLNPVNEGDPAFRHLPVETDNENELKRIPSDDVPNPVRRTLESSTQYTGWEKALIYENKAKDEYLIQFKAADKTTSYRFYKDGRPLQDD